MVVLPRQPGPCDPTSDPRQRLRSHTTNDSATLPAPPRTSSASKGVRVFVSYAHDTASHKTWVLRMCEFLRDRGADVHLDVWYCGPRRDWYVWAIEQITRADFVIVVASPACRRAGDGRMPSGLHRGIQTELALLRDRQHANRQRWQRKILPVILPGCRHRDIPLFLLPYCADYYTVDTLTAAGAASLLAALGLGQPTSMGQAGGRARCWS